MLKHYRYFRYLILHKAYVLRECWKRGLYWQGITHDWTKFLPREWKAFSATFAEPSQLLRETDEVMAMKTDLHSVNNPHHWEYWVGGFAGGYGLKLIEMPHKYAAEMVCDIIGAGLAKRGYDDSKQWYAANREKMALHPNTRAYVDKELGYGAHEEFTDNHKIYHNNDSL